MITFDITSNETLEYGYKYDSLTNIIQFTGFEMDDASNLLYLAFCNGTNYLIPLTSEMTISVGSPLTDLYGKAEGQLVEMSADGTFVKNSDIFQMFVKRSIPRDETADVSQTALATLYAQLYTLYERIVEQADQYATKDDLEAEVADAVTEYLEQHPVEAPVTSVNGEIGDVVIGVPVQSVNGQTGDVNLNIPTKTSELENDSEFVNESTLGEYYTKVQVENMINNLPVLLFD